MVGINSRWFFEEVSVGGKQLVQDQHIPVACFLIALLPKSYVLLKIMKKAFSMPLKGYGQVKKSKETKKEHRSCRCHTVGPEQRFSNCKQSKINIPGFCSYRNTHHRALSSQANAFRWLIKLLKFTLELNQLQKQFVASYTP